MPTLYLAANHIGLTSALNYGHLQLVYNDGVKLVEIEVQAGSIATLGDWVFLKPREHAGGTPYYGEEGYYKSVELNIGTRSASEVWDSFVGMNEQFFTTNPSIGYDVGKNSNSFITTLLSRLNIDANSYISSLKTSHIDSFPGIGVDVLKTSAESIPLAVQGTTGDDSLVGGASSDSISGLSGDDFLAGHVFDLASFGSTDGERDYLFGGTGYDGYRLGREEPGQTVEFNYTSGVGYVADDAFDYGMFSSSDMINDLDGNGFIIYRAPDLFDLNLGNTIWTPFGGYDGIQYDFKTSSTVYILSQIVGERYDYDQDQFVFEPYSVKESGFNRELFATMHQGDLFLFEWEYTDSATYLPVGVVQDYTMADNSYAQSDLSMLFA